VRKHCREGLRLCSCFTKALKVWGLAKADRQAVELLPLGLIRLKEVSLAARIADEAHFKARHDYAVHVANCLICSRDLVSSE
jgi:hypothetical protein